MKTLRDFEYSVEQGCSSVNERSINLYSPQYSSFVISFPGRKISTAGEIGLIRFSLNLPGRQNYEKSISFDLIINGIVVNINSSFLTSEWIIQERVPLHQGRIHIGLSFYTENARDMLMDGPINISDLEYFEFIKEANKSIDLIDLGRSISQKFGLFDENLEAINIEALGFATRALDAGSPFSIIRLGDGEGRILGFPQFFSQLEILEEVIQYQYGLASVEILRNKWGLNWLQIALIDLRSKLVESIESADFLGLPIVKFFDGFRDKPNNGHLGYAAANLAFSGIAAQDTRDFSIVGTNIFQQTAMHENLFLNLLKKAKNIYLIGPWDLSESVKSVYGVDRCKFICVRPHGTWGGLTNEGNYPNYYLKVMMEISALTEFSGSLFLVGAGVLGKFLCHHIKIKGGVALDIGSVFDSWEGRGIPYAVSNEVTSLGERNNA